MAKWLREQPDFQTTPLYSVGYLLKKRFTIDYYLPEKKATHILYDTAGFSLVKRFYLVETNAHDLVPPEVKKNFNASFEVQEVFFGSKTNGPGGVISLYTKVK